MEEKEEKEEDDNNDDVDDWSGCGGLAGGNIKDNDGEGGRHSNTHLKVSGRHSNKPPPNQHHHPFKIQN